MFKWRGCVKKWLILVFLGVASFICICPGCRIKSQQAVLVLYLCPLGGLAVAGITVMFFCGHGRLPIIIVKDPTERGVGGLTLFHELHSAPAVGPSTPLFHFTVHTTKWTSVYSKLSSPAALVALRSILSVVYTRGKEDVA